MSENLNINDLFVSSNEYNIINMSHTNNTKKGHVITMSIEEIKHPITADFYVGVGDNKAVKIKNLYDGNGRLITSTSCKSCTTFNIYAQGSYGFKDVEVNLNTDEFDFDMYNLLDTSYGTHVKIKCASKVLFYLAKRYYNSIYFPDALYEVNAVTEYISTSYKTINTDDTTSSPTTILADNDFCVKALKNYWLNCKF